MAKPKTLTFTIPPPLSDGSCAAECPLLRVVTITPDTPGQVSLAICGAAQGEVSAGALYPILFPGPGCPRRKESKRCRA